MKNKEKYIVELDGSEVKRIGYMRWMIKNKMMLWLYVSLGISLVGVMLINLVESLESQDWILYLSLSPMVVWDILIIFVSPKAEKKYLEEVKKNQVTNLR